MLIGPNSCERFATSTGAHATYAHADATVTLGTDYRYNGDSALDMHIMVPLCEAREIVQILQLAIASVENYQASIAANPASALMSATFEALDKPKDGGVKTTTDEKEG